MKLEKILKIILSLVPAILFFSGAIFLSAFYANFTVNVQHIDATLAPLENTDHEFTVSFAPSSGVGNESYHIAPFPHCNQYDDDWNCVDPALDLCPYLSLELKDDEEPMPTPDVFGVEATGKLNNPTDLTDDWNLTIKSPCFEGECPSDYDESQSGAPLAQSLKGQTFKCDFWVETSDLPVLVKNYLKNNIAYADDLENSIEVSAVFTGELPEPTRNPVIIVPGLLGTEIIKSTDDGPEKLWLDLSRNLSDIGDQFMDALQFNVNLTPLDINLTVGDVIGKILFFDYTEGLVTEFESQGYVKNTDLFLLPYDWRHGVSEENINKLKQKITDVLEQTNAEKVDVVVHSTGGLLLKKYVVENPIDHHIDKAVFVGVPNTGAPKAIKVFIQGDSFGVPLLADGEMKKISKNLPVAYDLSPSEQYFNKKGSYVKIVDSFLFQAQPDQKDLNFEEANDFLINDHELNAQALDNAHSLHTADFDNYDLRTAGVELFSINGCKAGTIGQFVEQRFHVPSSDAYSSLYYTKETPGDGTVPLESSTNLPINTANKYYALESNHGKMLSQDGIRQQIVNIISGSDFETEKITQDISECKLSGRAVSIFSPLSISIVDQDGNHAGLASDGVSIENDIPNADFHIVGDHKFVYLPTDEGQTYTISVAGTGTGTFTLTDATFEENNITQTQVFSNISVTPSLLGFVVISNDTNTTLSLDINGDGTTDETLAPTSVLDAEQSQNFIPEQQSNNSSEDDTEDIAAVHHGGRRFVSSAASENDTTYEEVNSEPVPRNALTVEVPVTNQTKPQKNVSIVHTKTNKNTESISIETPAENPPQESTLTASATESNALTSNAAVIITLAGVVGILLLAKKFIKL